MPAFPYVVLAGNIASGKSTVARILSDELGLEPYYEGIDRNPFFGDFYSDPARWAFHSQLAFMCSAIEDHVHIATRRRPAIQDRCANEMLNVFARHHADEGNISPAEYSLLERLLAAVDGRLAEPSLLVYVEASLDELTRRVTHRARPEERALTRSYLAALDALYEPFLTRWTISPVLRLRTDEADVREGPGRAAMVESVEEKLVAGSVRN
jgi:deoxyadenosine/deoxycytidine kinase